MPSATRHSVIVTISAAGTRTANSHRRSRPVTTTSRKTPLAVSAVPASVPIRIADSEPKKIDRITVERLKLWTPPAGP